MVFRKSNSFKKARDYWKHLSNRVIIESWFGTQVSCSLFYRLCIAEKIVIISFKLCALFTSFYERCSPLSQNAWFFIWHTKVVFVKLVRKVHQIATESTVIMYETLSLLLFVALSAIPSQRFDVTPQEAPKIFNCSVTAFQL